MRLKIIRTLRWGLPCISVSLIIFMLILSYLNQDAPLNLMKNNLSPPIFGLDKPQLYLITTRGARITLKSDSALPKDNAKKIDMVEMENIKGDIKRNNGEIITLNARSGSYKTLTKIITLTNGFIAIAPQGQLTADRATIPLNEKDAIQFDGNVSMIYTP